MRTFGQYQTTIDLARKGFCTVSATADEASATWNIDRAFAVKSITDPAFVVGDQRAVEVVDAFIESADVQRRAVEGGAQHWAPVHEMGRQGRGAFYATDRYAASAKRLADARYYFDMYSAAGLRAIAEGALAGLAELRESQRRAHGNLTAGNILVSEIGQFQRGKVVLADPAPSSEIFRRGVTEADDLRALGNVLHEQILHMPFRELGGWPIVPGPAWDRFGGGLGEAWRDVVSWLVDPRAKPESRTIEGAQGLIAALPKPSNPRAKKRSLQIAAAALVLASPALVFGGMQAYEAIRLSLLEFDPVAWGSLVESNDDWVGPLAVDIEEAFRDDDQRALWEGDAWLSDRLLPAFDRDREDAIDLDPVSIAEDFQDERLPRAITAEELIATPPAGAERPRAIEATAEALDVVQGLPIAWGEGWPARGRLERAADDFVARGWDRPAELASQLVAQLDDAPDATLGERIAAVLRAEAAVNRIDDAWRVITERRDAFSGSGDRVLAAFASAVEAEIDRAMVAADEAESDDEVVRADVLVSLADSLGEYSAVASEIADFVRSDAWTNGTAQEHFARTSKTHRRYAADGARDAGLVLYDDWLAEVRTAEYVRLPDEDDPRRGWAVVTTLREVSARADVLTTAPTLVDSLEDGLRDVVASAETALADADSISLDRVPWVVANDARVTREADRLSSEASSLRRRIDSIAAEVAELEATWLSDVLAEGAIAATGSAVVDATWRQLRDAALEEIDPADDFRAAYAAVEGLRDVLMSLDAGVEAADAARADAEPRDWRAGVLEAAVTARREAVLSSAIDDLDWRRSAFERAGEVDAVIAAANGEYAGWQGEVWSMVAAFADAEALLDEVYEADEAGPGGESAGAIVDDWRVRQVFAQAAGEASFAPILDRVAEGRAIAAGERGERALVAVATTVNPSRPELTLASWRALGDVVPAWPRTADDLDSAALSLEALRGLAETGESAARTEALLAELDAAATDVWASAARAAASPTELRSVMARRIDFGVDASDLDPAMRADVARYELEAFAEDSYLQDDDAVIEGVRAYIDAVNALGQREAQQLSGRLQAMLARAAQSDRRVDFNELGPAALGGWTFEELDPLQRRVAFYRDGEDVPAVRREQSRIEFELVRPDPGVNGLDEPVFISKREVSLALVRSGVDEDGWERVRDVLTLSSSGGEVEVASWAGPRVWAWPRGGLFTTGLSRNRRWLVPLPSGLPGETETQKWDNY
ncbi:MAG: hypothetical protein AAF747_03775, partial [Planctomycetota bacterium]